MKVIKLGSKGALVKQWQYFLLGQGLLEGTVDGKFGVFTKEATLEFQFINDLEPDGIVGNYTYGKAMLLGFMGATDKFDDKSSINWPPKPDFEVITSNSKRHEIFGQFDYEHNPIPGNYENIRVMGNWASENIVRVEIPQLISIKGTANVSFHKLAAQQLKDLWQAWEDEQLLHLVLTWHGSYVHRYIRGSTRTLSNHAFGTAFDINANWNWLGAVPALTSKLGSVRELVTIANDFGFYWGGHYSRRLDGMHFEVAVLK